MPDVTVHRHGDRWAVRAPGEESPSREFPSREAAELAARHLAAGGEVRVLEDDPTGLERVQDADAGEPAPGAAADDNADPTGEGLRDRQAGL